MLRPRTIPKRWLRFVPGLLPAAQAFKRVASVRVGRHPAGLLMLLPLSLLLDFFDVFDEMIPIAGPLVSMFLETAFVLGVTGNPAWAVGLAGFDLIPFVDVVPVATLTVLRELWKAYERDELLGAEAPPVTIDVKAARVE